MTNKMAAASVAEPSEQQDLIASAASVRGCVDRETIGSIPSPFSAFNFARAERRRLDHVGARAAKRMASRTLRGQLFDAITELQAKETPACFDLSPARQPRKFATADCALVLR